MRAHHRFPSARPSVFAAFGVVLAASAALFSGCAVVVERDGPPPVKPRPAPDAAATHEPPSRYGNPESYEVFGTRYYTLKSSVGFRERGVASWYGTKFHGRRTSSGETYDMYQMTAAHKSLPLPTYVKVTNLENGRSATLKVNDRGPFHGNRIIDLSYAAALKLGVAEKGTALVEVEAVSARSAPARPTTVASAPAPATPGADPAAVTAQSLFLQVGAFSERPNAERLSAEIGRYVPNRVHVRESNDAGQPIYRVHVGPIATVDSADQLVATLTDLGIAQHHFVTN
ncbi:MAG: septal ring lytic transglycosylase RlpA family protein [Gammaproteobacteria bacterium]|jgi:rare lipoprotein A